MKSCNPAIANTVNANIKTKTALESWENDANKAIIMDLNALIEDIVLNGLRTLNDLKELRLTLESIKYGKAPVTMTIKSKIFHVSLR